MPRTMPTEEARRPDRAKDNRGEIIRVRAGAWIAGGALAIGTLFLVISLFLRDAELRTWATGLISLVVGTAIGFVFSNANRNS